MEKMKVDVLFTWLDETTQLIQQHMEETYLDSLSITLETLFFQQAAEDMDDILTHKLESALKNIQLDTYEKFEIRKAIQLAILKGMKDSTQQQHLMTPETIAMLIGYLTNKLTAKMDSIRLFDPASGTGNLLTIVMEQLEQPVQAFGSEVDPTLIQLAVWNANLQKTSIEFFHQDSLRPFLLDPVDVVVADLPVGYYPDDVRASDFELKADEGHSYAHHLFIEQSMNYTKDGGYLLFIAPNFLFDDDQSAKLHKYIQKHAYISGVLQLPETAFKAKENAKCIVILQKKGEQVQAPKQPLLVQLPSLSNAHAMEDILSKMNDWFNENTNN
ncbi:class I SAM-dependent methyltransferase [Ornithinibacillus gellani]|uniref:class I SAM-dependent methyltransferase n=1 Tax=Ornithinibacillus gellani TaxID=2293253 RepID=UPI000F466526|nr:class I SAM-dependent methyltransferase [Ornithinibacillus gellani]TQS76280.1 class I SAM-dependent methyltransferase [Ornithinibacillus gellani]